MLSTIIPTPLLLLILIAFGMQLRLSRAFDIRGHLATKTRYAFKAAIPGAPSVYNTPDPQGYKPALLWLLARHGSRLPTKDRMRQINTLEALFKDARNLKDYPWMRGWTSPFKDLSLAGGELHVTGGDEHFALGERLRRRFPSIAEQEYYPKRFPVQATEVARASASAQAFTSGFFPPVAISPVELNHMGLFVDDSRVMLGLQNVVSSERRGWRSQAVAIRNNPKHDDPLLRFFDVCPKYDELEKDTKQWLTSWKVGNWSLIASKVQERLQLERDMDPCEVESLWQLCQTEAGLYEKIDGACSMFSVHEVALLEWIEDVDLMQFHSYGAEINYISSTPTLADMYDSLRAAAEDKESTLSARLLFGHCETLVPLATLLGLFKEEDGSDYNKVDDIHSGDLELNAEHVSLLFHMDKELGALLMSPQDLSKRKANSDREVCYKGQLIGLDTASPPEGWSPKVPFCDERVFRGARVSPYAANLAVVLYREQGAAKGSGADRHLIRLLYNEQVIPIPGCTPVSPGSLDYPLTDFLDSIRDLADANIGRDACIL